MSANASANRSRNLGCPVAYYGAAKNFIGPCHGGVYGFLGERIGGAIGRAVVGDFPPMRIAAGDVSAQHAVLAVGRLEQHREDRRAHAVRACGHECGGHDRR